MIYTTTPRPEPKKIIVALHHTAVSRKKQPLQYDAVNTFHKNKDWGGGWKQKVPTSLGKWGGYNVFCEPTGERGWYRRYGEETIAQRGFNCTSLGNCFVLSYCMAGDFRVEKPTDFQVSDFQSFIKELQAAYPNAVIEVQQHHNLDANRTCAELTAEYIAEWFRSESGGKDKIIASLREENAKLKKQVKKLIGYLQVLIKYITK